MVLLVRFKLDLFGLKGPEILGSESLDAIGKITAGSERGSEPVRLALGHKMASLHQKIA